jgi:tetratricopeptide (TPR) repeat protein
MSEHEREPTQEDIDKVAQEIAESPELVTHLVQAGLYLSAGQHEKAEALFRKIPKDFPRYPLAASGLFGILWERGTEASRAEAIALMNEFIETADRNYPQVKPVLLNFMRIKVGLLSAGVINEPPEEESS